jgi:malate synthase
MGQSLLMNYTAEQQLAHLPAATDERFSQLLTPEALRFLGGLEEHFGSRRQELLEDRAGRQVSIDNGVLPDFLPDTRDIRDGLWQVAPPKADLTLRRVEITGPVDRKMVINALNSTADVFMADFEDSASPTWATMMEGQLNLIGAVKGSLHLTDDRGKEYDLQVNPATLMVRPRGLHLEERHITLDGLALSASFVDFGLFLFHNAHTLLSNDSGPYFYLPKLEGHLEARLWNDVFVFAQDYLGIPQGSIRATVLIETILAAFEMDEILFELKDHSAGLNAGRWDYIFSAIKKFRSHLDKVFPDRSQITMSVPFMDAYTSLLVQTCHKRGAHAMGGMAAFIPSRRDEQVNRTAFAKVQSDKTDEAVKGHDGTWVAHPDLIEVARDAFEAVIGGQPHQIDRLADAAPITAAQLLDFRIPEGVVTSNGVSTNVDVAIQYIASWLTGRGAVAIYNLMEDAATAEISRSQLWQWLHNGVVTVEGQPVNTQYLDIVAERHLTSIAAAVGEELFSARKYTEAWDLLRGLVLADDFTEFLTLPAYELID